MSTKKPAEHPRRLQLFRQFLLLKKLSRDLNYDVIIERTREGILCRDNHQDGKTELNMNFENFCVLVEHYKKSKPHLFELEADCTVDDRQISIIENEYGIVLPDSYKNLIKNFGGGYFGFIAFYSFDQNSPFDFSKNVSVKLIKELMLLPVVDLETGDYIGYEVKDNICTEKLFLLNHDDNSKRPLDKNIYEILISCGMENEQV